MSDRRTLQRRPIATYLTRQFRKSGPVMSASAERIQTWPGRATKRRAPPPRGPTISHACAATAATIDRKLKRVRKRTYARGGFEATHSIHRKRLENASSQRRQLLLNRRKREWSAHQPHPCIAHRSEDRPHIGCAEASACPGRMRLRSLTMVIPPSTPTSRRRSAILAKSDTGRQLATQIERLCKPVLQDAAVANTAEVRLRAPTSNKVSLTSQR